jgi:hypothetical protein
MLSIVSYVKVVLGGRSRLLPSLVLEVKRRGVMGIFIAEYFGTFQAFAMRCYGECIFYIEMCSAPSQLVSGWLQVRDGFGYRVCQV